MLCLTSMGSSRLTRLTLAAVREMSQLYRHERTVEIGSTPRHRLKKLGAAHRSLKQLIGVQCQVLANVGKIISCRYIHPLILQATRDHYLIFQKLVCLKGQQVVFVNGLTFSRKILRTFMKGKIMYKQTRRRSII